MSTEVLRSRNQGWLFGVLFRKRHERGVEIKPRKEEARCAAAGLRPRPKYLHASPQAQPRTAGVQPGQPASKMCYVFTFCMLTIVGSVPTIQRSALSTMTRKDNHPFGLERLICTLHLYCSLSYHDFAVRIHLALDRCSLNTTSLKDDTLTARAAKSQTPKITLEIVLDMSYFSGTLLLPKQDCLEASVYECFMLVATYSTWVQ